MPGTDDQLVGKRLLLPLEGWLRQLHDLPAHGNRNVFADHVLVAHLVAFLSPALKSLRRIESVFEHPAARKRFGLPRLPKSTLSDAQAVFDPTLLEPILDDLRRRVPNIPNDPDLEKLLKTLTAVDGSFFTLAPRVWWALYNKPNTPTEQSRRTPPHGNVRFDFHFNVLTGVPEKAILTNGRTPEYQTLAANIEPDRFYVLDRAYHCYDGLGAIVAIGSDFLVRLRKDMKFTVCDELPVSPTARAAGVQRVQIVEPQGWRARHGLGLLRLKLVTLRCDDGREMRLLTNRIDLDPELIGLVYRYRWQIELFFRWLKVMLDFRHFFSEHPNGLALQMGAAVIGTLLLALVINGRPSSYDWAMMTHVFSGLIPDDDETRRIMNRRRAERARAAEWQKAYRARKKTAR